MTGVILAGGQSRRMGQDKCLLKLKGKELILYAASILEPNCDKIIISSNNTNYSCFGYPVIPDLYSLRGPLGGIVSVMKSLDSNIFAFIPCDMPFVPPELFVFLVENKQGKQAVVPVFNGEAEPLVMIIDKTVLPVAEKFLKAGNYKILNFLNSINTKFVEIDASAQFFSFDMFVNINTPEDYARLQG
jgi:molybdenum cofactor guanylyltransferase